MSDIFSIISLSSILTLPWYILLFVGLLLAWHIVRLVVALSKRHFLKVFSGLVGIFVVLVFLTVGGQLYPVWSGDGVFSTSENL